MRCSEPGVSVADAGKPPQLFSVAFGPARLHFCVRRKSDAMSDNAISVIELAAQNGFLKQSVFKVIKRLGIEPIKRLGTNSRGQAVAYITKEEAQIVVAALRPAHGLAMTQDESSYLEGELQ